MRECSEIQKNYIKQIFHKLVLLIKFEQKYKA